MKWWRRRRRDRLRGREPHFPDHYPVDGTMIQRIDMSHRGSPSTLWPFTTDAEAMRRAGAEWMEEPPS